MAKKPKAKENKKQKSGSGKMTLLIMLVSLIMIVVFKLGFLFFIIGILPSIVSYYIDATRSNLSFQTVFTCNLAGVLPSMAEMIKGGASNSAVQQVISNNINWLVVYAAAGLGWVLVFITPIISQMLINTLHQRQIARLKRQQHILVAEWGSELESYLKKKENDE